MVLSVAVGEKSASSLGNICFFFFLLQSGGWQTRLLLYKGTAAPGEAWAGGRRGEGPSGLTFRALRGGAPLLAGTCLSFSAPDSGDFDVGEQWQLQEAQGTPPSWGGVGWGPKGLGQLLGCEKRLPNV